MKPQLLKISLGPGHSFSARHDAVPVFYNKWHYHKELELVYVLKGTGNLFVGYDIRRFKAGELVLIGSNLPHMWGSDRKMLKKNGRCESYVIHFLPDCLGSHFFALPENKAIRSVLAKAQRGISIKGDNRDFVLSLMKELLHADATNRVILLLRILCSIASTKNHQLICAEQVDAGITPQDSDRLNNIYQYTIDNFAGPIKLDTIAGIANLAPNSFCRYFKSRTRKSYSRLLMELRINHACKLLAETQKPVADICYESGYNSFSNFNRHFRLIMTHTPLGYRKNYQQV
jgi:AraC-like DNA-binding protein